MIEIYKVEEKSKEEALRKLNEKSDQTIEQLYIKEKEIEGSLFKSKKVALEAVRKTDVINYAKEFLEKLSKLMGVDIQSEIKEIDEVINIVLISENTPLIIGKEGRTLNSLQILLRQSIRTQTGFNIKVNIDASNYKAQKMSYMERDIKKIIKEVLDTHIDVKLDPMNSYERRFVHNIVSDYPQLSSDSDGTGSERYITIKYHDEK